jgi:hypothetical protein
VLLHAFKLLQPKPSTSKAHEVWWLMSGFTDRSFCCPTQCGACLTVLLPVTTLNHALLLRGFAT